ncbi:MAG: OsmC family protein [Gemmatimonadota bacterium]
MPSQRLTFTGAGGAKLAARLELPSDRGLGLAIHRDPATPEARQESPGSRVVARIGASGYRTDILANGHPLVADEPLSVGGTDTGPSPYDLLLAALGACKTITLRIYADRKGWPLEEVTVALEHRKLHATDAEECEDRPAKLDEIRSGLHLVGPLEEAQRQRLAEIADRCPVHRTLDAGVQLVSKLENGALASGSAQH